jgi:lactoylglutathione lyase
MKFCWVTINVKNMEESLKFYQDVVGLKINRRINPVPDTEIAFLGSEGTSTEVELIKNEKNPDPQHGRDISIGFIVASVETAMKKLKDRQIQNIEGPFQPGPYVRFIFIHDPDGVRVQFVENIEQ